MKKLNLIWDMDGTLVDTEQDALEKLALAAQDAGLDLDKQESPFRIGPTVDVIFKSSFPEYELTEEKIDTAVKSFRHRYDSSTFENIKPFDGIDEIISDGRFCHYIITNKPDVPANKIVMRIGWNSKFKRIITPYSFNGERKCKNEIFDYLVKEEGLETSNTLGIGDMPTDCKAAHYAGIKSIGVLWGTGTRDELFECDYICKTTAELKELIEELKEQMIGLF